MQDFLTQNYSAGIDSLFVSEYHGHFMSNKSPTRFQWKIHRIELILVSDPFFEPVEPFSLWCCFKQLDINTFENERKKGNCTLTLICEITCILFNPWRRHSFFSYRKSQLWHFSRYVLFDEIQLLPSIDIYCEGSLWKCTSSPYLF